MVVDLSHWSSRPKRVLLAGDLLVDRYIHGKVSRISPEAPVPIVQVDGRQAPEVRMGGSGNALMNLAALGAQVDLLGRIGDDSAGELFLDLLAEAALSSEALVREPGWPTPLKERIMANGQQLVRVDYEQSRPLSRQLEEELIGQLPGRLEGIDLVVISDYGKGFLTERLLAQLIAQARRGNLPIVADPKGRRFSRYNGVTLLKPNVAETYAAAAVDPSCSLEEAAWALLDGLELDQLMVTRAEEGISLFSPTGQVSHHPTQVHQVRDVTGAGDTVLATVAMALSHGHSYQEGALLANVAAGIAIEQLGCAVVTLAELQARLRASSEIRSQSGVISPSSQ